jgi:hypothetical protein
MPTRPERRWRFQCRERSPDDEWRSDERSLGTRNVTGVSGGQAPPNGVDAEPSVPS